MYSKLLFAAGVIVILASPMPALSQAPDSTAKPASDTLKAAAKPAADTLKAAPEKSEKSTKQKLTYILYFGGNANDLSVSGNSESTTATGYHLGFSVRRKSFFYWQLGLRYNVPSYTIGPKGDNPDSLDNDFSASFLEIPVTAGINILSATDRVLNLRGFVSAYPSFNLTVDENRNIQKDDLNSTVFFGQVGIGVDVLFLVVETGYNFGFGDLMKNDVQSVPQQIFLSIGLRF